MYQNIFITRKTDTAPATAYVWDDSHGLLSFPYSDFQYAYKADPKGQYTSLYGQKLKKVKNPKFDETGLFESDVPRETRVLTDMYLDSDELSTGHRILCSDIEVDSTHGFATTDTAENEITAIANYDYVADKYTCFLLDKERRMASSVKGNEEVISCESESVLLDRWLDYFKKVDPTIITGWNVDGYDIPYLYNRLKRVKGYATAKSLSPIGQVIFNEHRNRFQIAGRSVLDYILLYKKYIPQQKPSYRLHDIGLAEVNMGKVEYEGTLDTLFATDLQKFLDYNLTDVKIVVAIDRKKRFIDLCRAICHTGHVQYEDFAYSSKFIEGTILTYLHRMNIIAPNKPEGGREAFNAKMESDEEGFTGAFVKPPFPGLYEWVYSLDLTSLYPSIIMSLNISPETKVGRVTNWNTELHGARKIESYNVEVKDNFVVYTRDEFLQFLATTKYNVSSNGILYSTDKVGVIPEILDVWFKQRKTYKKLMFKAGEDGDKEKEAYYDQMQQVQKVFLNSIYGVLGLSIFRFYDLDNAEAVTATGQDVIKTTAKYINAEYKKLGVPPKTDLWIMDYWNILREDAKKRKKPAPEKPHNEDHCVYIDTDSVYFSAQEIFNITDVADKKQYTIDLAKRMEEGVNRFYDAMAKRLFNCVNHRFSIKGESVIETGLWVAKKRYAMNKVYDLESDHPVEKMAVKGLDTVRSSFPPAFKKLMETVLNSILQRHSKESIDKIILDFVGKMPEMHYKQIAKNTAVKGVSELDDPKDKSLSTFPSGAPAHVKAALAYNRFLRNFDLDTKHGTIRSGDKIKWIYLKKNPYGLETIAVKTYDDPQQIEELIAKYIDYDMIFEKEMSNKLEAFYTTMKWGPLPTQVNQKAFEFFTFN